MSLPSPRALGATTLGGLLLLAPLMAPPAFAAETPGSVRINEIESDGGAPDDWVELVNPTTSAVDISGWILRDDDDSHSMVIAPGTLLEPGGYVVYDREAMGFGLGKADAVRLFSADGQSLQDSYAWTAHAAVTFARCPDGLGEFTDSTAATPGAANECGSPLRINEVVSSGGVPGDWIELVNSGTTEVDASGYILRDDDDTHEFILPAGTVIAPGGYYVADVDPVFGLGKADSARLFTADGGTLLDQTSWSAHGVPSWGRCADTIGEFGQTREVTRGAANICGTTPTAGPSVPPVTVPEAGAWPGGKTVATADLAGYFGENLSGLDYVAGATGAEDVLWAVKNGPGTLYKLIRSGEQWIPSPEDGWSAGKTLRFPDGTGDVDAEGVTVTAEGVFISIERDNDQGKISRAGVLRVDPTAPGTELTATAEWNLVSDLPTAGANKGLEAIEWIPDADLVARGFIDQSTGKAYDPSRYPNHGGGVFVVGLEENGQLYVYVLTEGGTASHRISSFSSGFPSIMDLEYEAQTGELRAVCDDTCDGRSMTHAVSDSGAFAPVLLSARPEGMPNVNNEGFTVASESRCVDGLKEAFWSDDNGTDGHSLRVGTIECVVKTVPTPSPSPSTGGGTEPNPDSSIGIVPETDTHTPNLPGTVAGPDRLGETGFQGGLLLGLAGVLLLAGAGALGSKRARNTL